MPARMDNASFKRRNTESNVKFIFEWRMEFGQCADTAIFFLVQ